MAIEFTKEQQRAIDARDRALIVSAAAGSGKTAVLVRRVIGLITGDKPVPLNRLLIVTFTNAAAGEMRSRIGKALGRELAQNPGDKNLARQLAMLADCRIQTVHAFCQELLRANAGALDIPGDFVIADEIRCRMLMDRAMTQVLEEAYAQNDPGFAALVENLCEERGDRRLEDAVRDLHEKLTSFAHPEDWLRRAARPEEDGRWQSRMLDMARERMTWALGRVDRGEEILEGYPDIAKKYGGAFAACREFGQGFLAALDTGWDEAAALAAAFETPAFDRGLRNADKTVTEDLKALRDEFAAAVVRIRKECVPASAAVIADEARRTAPMTRALCGLVSRFAQVYGQLKLARGLLDFSDLEHYTLRLLRGQDGGPSEVARALSRELCEIMVDEYQDTNEIQEEIYTLITPESGSLFFVGDIKQSIYRFRRANPEIFIRRYLSGVPLEEEGPQARLALNRNFRSLDNVLALSNFVFSRIMSAPFGDIDYDGEQRLYTDRPGEGQSELWVIDSSGIRGEEEEAAVEVEARLVAGRIAQMLEEETVPEGEGRRPIRPDDMAILLSSFNNKAPAFVQALARRGIPVSAPGREDFFASVEIAVLLSYLRIIDNPYQDIPLISVLRSPLYLFSADRLVKLRLPDKTAPLIDCLRLLAGEGDEACIGFLRDLEDARRRAVDLSVGALLRHIIARTGAAGVFSALDDGPARRGRLERLVGMALEFEGTAAKGLYPFLGYIDRRIEQAENEAITPVGDGVRLMSIHGSKGLEFPVVFLPDLAKRFNRDDLNKPVLLSPSLGIGMRLRDHGGRAERRTCLQTAIATTLAREGGGEEMRKLYVAMTRAREKLVLVMSVESLPKKLRAWSDQAGERISPEFLAAQSGAAPWLCAALMTHPGAGALRELAQRPLVLASDAGEEELFCRVLHWSDVAEEGTVSPRTLPQQEAPAGEAFDYTPWLDRMGRTYPFAAVSALPSKLTPAGVRARIEDAGEIEGTPGKTQVRMFRKSELKSRRGLTAAQRGTAAHLFLRWADPRKWDTMAGCVAERDRLVAAGRLDAEEGESLCLEDFLRFARSDAGRRAVEAGHRIREYRFGALFTPDELLGNGVTDEEILLNGAIDLLLFNADRMEVVDFKTDSVLPGQEAAAAEVHRLQLELYAKAAEKIFGGRVERKTVFFLKTGTEIEL